MIKDPVYKQALKNLFYCVLSIALTRFSQGLWLGALTLIGLVWALSGKAGKALSIYVLIISMVGLNPLLLPANSSVFGYLVRFGPLAIGLALMLKGGGLRGQSRVPLGMLVLYLGGSMVSSMNGWAPVVSYLKLANFFVFILGFWFGLHTLNYDQGGINYLRASFLAFSAFLIIGSALLLPFPGISTLSGMQLALREGNVEAANAAMASVDGAVPLFCGVTRQSQFFAPLCAATISWLIADMLFVEQQFSKIHLVMIGIGVPLLYLSRSRTGLLSLIVGIVFVAIYLPRRIMLPKRIKKHIRTGVSAILLLSLVVAVISEISGGSISQWVRKVERLEDDSRSWSEAVTSSRQGLIDESMNDFHSNPVFGRGFQVDEGTAEMVARARTSFVISASIEKGVLPVMILGEAGIVGAIFFCCFLFSFYSISTKRRLYVTAALFAVLLASNMGEATFFSPGGLGGLLWAVCVIGGYCVDMLLSDRQRMYAGVW